MFTWKPKVTINEASRKMKGMQWIRWPRICPWKVQQCCEIAHVCLIIVYRIINLSMFLDPKCKKQHWASRPKSSFSRLDSCQSLQAFLESFQVSSIWFMIFVYIPGLIVTPCCILVSLLSSQFRTFESFEFIWQFKLRLFWICGASPSIKYAMMTVKKGADAWTTSKHVKLTRIPATSRSLVEYYMIILIYSGRFGSGYPGILYAMGPFGTV